MTLTKLPINPYYEIDTDKVSIARVARDLANTKDIGFEIRVDGIWIGRLYEDGGKELQDWWMREASPEAQKAIRRSFDEVEKRVFNKHHT